MPVKCAIYCRVSSEEQSRKATSIPVQERQCKEWAKSLGWLVHPRVYKDEGFSGTTVNRPAFLDMVEDAKAGLFQKIVVYAVDRWGRSAADVALKEELQSAGIRFAYYLQNEPDDDGTKLGISVEEVLARNFSKVNARRVSAGQREAVRQGRIGFGGRPPYGYQVKYVDKRRAFVRDPATSPIVGEIFRRYVEGASVWGVAEWLNDRKIPTSSRTAARWHSNVVHKILQNPLYTGDLIIGRHKGAKSSNGKRTSKRVTDKSAWVVAADALPALVDRHTFEAAQQRFKENKRHKKSSDHPGNPLSGKLGKCVNCGGPVSIERNHPESSNKKAKYYFLCVRHRRMKTSPKE